jgi:gliding motility-associated-like protein
MKTISLLFLVCAAFLPLHAQLPTFTWAKAIGGSGTMIGNSVCTDAAGNTYTFGTFNAEADFNPDPSETDMLASFGEDAFAVKLDSDGNFVWAIRIGGNGIDEGNFIMLDENDHLVVTGRFEGIVDFDPGPEVFTLTSQGSSADIFVAKYSTDGDLIWARSLGSEGGDDPGGLAIDPLGAIFIAGDFGDVGTLQPGNTPVTSNGNFICKLSSNGTFQWAINIGSANIQAIALSATNDILITGEFSGTVDFDPGVGIEELYAFVDHIFIAMYTHDGEYAWAYNIGSGDYDSQGTAITTDASGAVFVTGYYSEDMDFDPGAGTFILDGNINGLAFILKLANDGSFAWADRFDAYESRGSDVKADADGNVWILGDTNPEGPWSTFIAVFDSDGEEIVYEEFGTDCFGNSLALGATGEAFITGWFQDYSDFDFESGETGFSPIGSQDLYVMKLGGVPAQPIDEDLEIFNFISANGDEINACLYIQNIEASASTSNNTVKIFNRWGDVVWETKNYNNTDRAFKGKTGSGNELPSGTYYYKIEFAEGKTRTGFLSLLR